MVFHYISSFKGRILMNKSVKLWPVTRGVFALGLVTIFASCSTGTPRSVTVPGFEPIESSTAWEEDRYDNQQLANNDAAWFLGTEGDQISRETLSVADMRNFGLEVREGAYATELHITGAQTGTPFEVTFIEEPSRLVVDILDGISRESAAFETTDSTMIDRVRIGRHPDKSRLVLDLKEGSTPTYTATEFGQAIVVSISDRPRTIAAATPPSTTPSTTEALIASGDSGYDREYSDRAQLAPELAAMEGEEAVQALPSLRALQFRETPTGRSVLAQMDSAGVFELSRTAPSEYVLRLEGATFDPELITTLVAPPGSGAIRSVRPVFSGSDTLLRIFVAPEAELQARVRGNAISVESTQFLASSDGRAQAEIAEIEMGDEILLPPGDLAPLDADVGALLDDAPRYSGRLISLDLQDTDIDNALRIIAEVSNLNIIASDDVTGKVTLRLIDVPWDQALDVILKTNGLDKVLEGNVMRIAPIEKLRRERESLKQARIAEEDLEPMMVKFVRVSYAKASQLRPLVETVITERGTVTYDERTNQLIIRDIRRGVVDALTLVEKLDLRTPQVLLETQIVEAQRSFLRDLGSEIGFSFIRSPETGNATGYNFPNAINVGGSVDGSAPGVGSSFPASTELTAGSAISFLLDSADGTRSLDYRLSALETEGRVRIVSRPSVATTNNQQATIKSVEKIRIKTPSGGLSVATGSGASAAGSGGVATETVEIGIVLEVTPQASPDYFVLLDINAKSSTLGSTVVDGIPSEVERSATSTVLVSSDQTFAMGGIYKMTDRDTLSGVPFLKDIPFLGHLFRRSLVDNADEELIFFITPRIVEGSFDDAAMKMSS